MPDLVVSFPGLAEWHRTAHNPMRLVAKEDVNVLFFVEEAFRRNQRDWLDFKILHVDPMYRGRPWGHGGVFPKPQVMVKDLNFGTKLMYMVARAVELAGAQADAPFKAQRIDYVKAKREAAPDFGGDFTAEASYSQRMHREANTKFSIANVVSAPDEIRLRFE